MLRWLSRMGKWSKAFTTEDTENAELRRQNRNRIPRVRILQGLKAHIFLAANRHD